MNYRQFFKEGYKAGYKRALNEARLNNRDKRIAAGNLPKQKLYWMAASCWELLPVIIDFCGFNEDNPDYNTQYLYDLNDASHTAQRLSDSLENWAPKLVGDGQTIRSAIKNMFKEINTSRLSIDVRKVRNYAKQASDALDKIIETYNLAPLIREMDDEGTATTLNSLQADEDMISGKDSWETKIETISPRKKKSY